MAPRSCIENEKDVVQFQRHSANSALLCGAEFHQAEFTAETRENAE
jgi:hypothetical protein